jgi:DNA-binding transcriptional LysR family regulator
VRATSLAGVDLNLLPALDALLTERSVSGAARRCSVGQPAMSGSLARLRAHFDDPLLVRRGRGSTLTPVAEGLVGPVRDAVAGVEAVLGRAVAFDPASTERTFTVATSDYVAVVLLRPLLADLAGRAPGVRLRIRPSPAGDDLADVVVRPAEIAREDARSARATLWTDHFRLTADAANAAIDDVDVARFLTMPYATVATPGRTLLERQLAEQGLERRPDVTTEAFAAVPLLLRGTPLVALVPGCLVRALDPHGALRTAAPPIPLRPLAMVMAWDPRLTADPAHAWLREQLLAAGAAIDGGDVGHRRQPFDLPGDPA